MPGRDTESVFEILDGNAELVAHSAERLPGLKPGQDILHSGAPPTEDRLPKAPPRVHDYFASRVLGKTDQAGVAIGCEIDPSQVGINDIGEDSLAVPDHNKLTSAAGFGRVGGLFGVVIRHLGTVGL